MQVGNWPGVTVEKKEAVFEYQGRKIKLVDLPGTYCLSPYSKEKNDYAKGDGLNEEQAILGAITICFLDYAASLWLE
jgi:Fe2+ transport system protein B